MIIQILLLTMGLDMSRPEFEPTTDISGNYIMGSYDVSSDDFVVEELEEVPEDVAPSVDDSLSMSPVRGEQLSVSGNNDVVSAIQSLQEDNNAYWELFLDSYDIVTDYSRTSSVLNVTWYVDANSSLQESTSGLLKKNYLPVTSGISYHVTGFNYPYSSATYRVFVVDSVSEPSAVTNFFTLSSGDSFDLIPSQNGFLVMQLYNNQPNAFTASWTTVVRESYTLSELGNAVMDISNVVSRLRETIRAILLFVLFAFAYPIALAIVKNIVGGDK